MFSSKFWFALVSVIMGAFLAMLLLAQNTYNTAIEDDTCYILIKDRDQALALLKAEARIRLDELLRISGSEKIYSLLNKASFTPDKVNSDDRAKLRTALEQQNKALESEDGGRAYKGDVIVAVDHKGTSIAQVWPDGPDKIGYSLGGFPSVRSALRGFVQDDVWALSMDPHNPDTSKVIRIATRPVISSGRYVGAIVHGQYLDSDFATLIARRLGAQVVFFRGPVVIASGLPNIEGYEAVSDQAVATPWSELLNEREGDLFEKGRSGVVRVSDGVFAVYSLVMGEAAQTEGANVGYAIVRRAPTIESSFKFVSSATLEDWGDLFGDPGGYSGFLLVGFILIVCIVGFLFFHFEHGRPIKILRKEVSKLSSREVDRLNIYAVPRSHRKTAESINKAIDKAVADVAEKLAKKKQPASIEQILGPSESSDRVSSALFTFDQEQDVPPPPPQGNAPPPGQGAPPPPMAPPAGAPPAGAPPAPPGAPPMQPGAPPAPPGMPPAPPGAPQGAPPTPQPGSATPSSPGSGADPLGGPPRPPSSPDSGALKGPLQSVPSLYDEEYDDDDDEDKTEIAGVPEELLIASQRDELPPSEDEKTYFHQIFEQFVATKQQCGERTDNLQFERFSQTLKRNRDALIERYGCKSVRFQVYVKEGKAALKATPVRN